MKRRLAVLRPEPGNAATVARIEATGDVAISLPLFAVRPIDWTSPDPAAFDALILTSANAPRQAGPGLAAYAHLPVYAVGAATAAAAVAAGLTVVQTGERAGAELADTAARLGVERALLLSGRHHVLDASGPIARAIAVYASDPLPIARSDLDRVAGSVALLHSARAARRLAELVDRATFRIAAISVAVADAAGPGWAHVAVAPTPDDATLIATALTLAD